MSIVSISKLGDSKACFRCDAQHNSNIIIVNIVINKIKAAKKYIIIIKVSFVSVLPKFVHRYHFKGRKKSD